MLNKYIVLLVILFSSTSPLTAQDMKHYFIKVNGKHDGMEKAYQYEYGSVSTDENFKVKLQEEAYGGPEQFLDSIKVKYPVADYDFNIYIHGMWANSGMHWRESASNLSKEVFSNIERPQVIVSFIWDAAILYPKSVSLARAKGKQISPIIHQLLVDNKGAHSINILAHSMGNRVFEEAIKPLWDKENIKISRYFSLAADLEDNIFNKNQPLENLSNICSDIYIYMHNNDRTLKVSKLINDNNRLGLEGINMELLKNETYKLIDVTLITDNEGIAADIFNHRYYYTSTIVKQDLNAILREKPSPLKKTLTSDNHYVLDPSLLPAEK